MASLPGSLRLATRRRQIGQSVIYQADCLRVLPDLAASGLVVDAVITDPPYGLTDNDWDQAPPLSYWWRLTWSLLKRTGIAAVCSQQLFTTDLISSARRFWRYEIVWEKSIGVGFLSAKQRPLRAHEHVQIFARKMGGTYNPQMTEGKPYARASTKGRQSSNWGRYNPVASINQGVRYPRSLLRFSNAPRPGRHPTAKPLELMEWLVATYTDPGDLVLDPYMGGCSTGAACLRLGRQFVGIEQDARYFQMATDRLLSLC